MSGQDENDGAVVEVVVTVHSVSKCARGWRRTRTDSERGVFDM
jgi:hypothetical protein